MIIAATTLLFARTPPRVPVQPGTSTAIAQARERASDLHFLNAIMATRLGDSRLYVILGSGFIRAVSAGDPEAFVARWLRRHPGAAVVPVSRMVSTNTKTHEPFEIVFIWIEEGAANLNVDLVGAGFFIGGTMADMVDNQQGLDRLLRDDLRLADERATVEAERARAPQDRTDRLVSDRVYRSLMLRIVRAERHARSAKLGVWSDAMMAERQAEGFR